MGIQIGYARFLSRGKFDWRSVIGLSSAGREKLLGVCSCHLAVRAAGYSMHVHLQIIQLQTYYKSIIILYTEVVRVNLQS